MVRLVRKLQGLIFPVLGVNSQHYWDARFATNWEPLGGRLQTALFACGFVAQRFEFDPYPKTILDYGCGSGDSIPVLAAGFPGSELSYFDFSSVAMRKAAMEYGAYASPHEADQNDQYDLVYCSNVIEHIENMDSFVEHLVGLARRYVIVQAPYDERHADGSKLSRQRPISEHVNTLDEESTGTWPKTFEWKVHKAATPYAWDRGLQVFFVGRRIADDQGGLGTPISD